MNIVIRAQAADDIDEIYAWIAQSNPRAAREMVIRIRDRIARLEHESLAHMGRPGRVEGTRELVEYPYIIVYRVADEPRFSSFPSFTVPEARILVNSDG
jgi:plasmid stabilization system protein ParE